MKRNDFLKISFSMMSEKLNFINSRDFNDLKNNLKDEEDNTETYRKIILLNQLKNRIDEALRV